MKKTPIGDDLRRAIFYDGFGW